MEGAAIIKLADLSSLWLETQVNVSINYEKLKVNKDTKLSFWISVLDVKCKKISF
jgi:Cu(I)/Ag(I) efflux system membrane fusion protein